MSEGRPYPVLVEPPSDTEWTGETPPISGGKIEATLGLDEVLQQHDGDEPNFDKPLREEDVLPGPAIARMQEALSDEKLQDWRRAKLSQGDVEHNRKILQETILQTITSPQNLTAQGGGLREDTRKLRYDLIPVYPLARLAEVYTLGCTKYSDRNWEKGIAYANCMAALKRHLEKWWSGEDESAKGQHHLASVIFWAMALMEYEYRETVPDERPK